MKKKKMLIVSGGSIQDRFASAFLNMQARAEVPPVLIAADRGLDHLLRLGFVPDLVIGDFDSVSEEGKRFLASAGEEKIVRLRPEKDETDTESALRLAVSRGAGEVTILGVTGTRLDHVLAGLALTAVGEELGCRVTLLDQHNLSTFQKYVSDVSVSTSGGKTVVTITLKPETVTTSTGMVYHPGLVGTAITPDNLQSLVSESANTRNVTGTVGASTIKATINSNYKLDALDISNPYTMSMSMSLTTVNVKTDLSYHYTFTYLG